MMASTHATWEEVKLSKSLSGYLQKMFHMSSFHFHTRLASSSYRVANFLENSRSLSNYLTSMLDFDHVILLSHLSAKSTLYFSNISIKIIKGIQGKSGDWEGHATGSPRPIHLWLNTVFKCSLTLRTKWAGASSCMYHRPSPRTIAHAFLSTGARRVHILYMLTMNVECWRICGIRKSTQEW